MAARETSDETGESVCAACENTYYLSARCYDVSKSLVCISKNLSLFNFHLNIVNSFRTQMKHKIAL